MTEPKRIPLAGVIGSPVAHSESPRIFAYWLKQLGLRGHYVPMDIASGDLETVLATLPKLGFVGVNVTIPHKEHVLNVADLVSDRAAVIGAEVQVITPVQQLEQGLQFVVAVGSLSRDVQEQVQFGR